MECKKKNRLPFTYASVFVFGMCCLSVTAYAAPLTSCGAGTGGLPTPWIEADVNLYYTLGNVGIGTNNPQATLDIDGSVRFEDIASCTMLGTNASGVLVCSSTSGSGGTPDITAVTAGFGLSGGATSGEATLSVDTTAIQARVSATCAAGSSIRAIAENGTVTCETDDNSGGTITGVTASNGLTGGGATGAVSVGIADGGVTAAKIGFDTDDISEGSSKKFYSDSLARAALSGVAPVSYNSTTGVIGLTQSGDILGTTDQISVSGGTNLLPGSSDVTLSLPQSIATASTPTFAGMTLTGALQAQTKVTVGANNSTAELELIAETGATDYKTIIKPSTDMTANVTFVLPSSGGTAGQMLRSGGDGVLSWVDPSSAATISWGGITGTLSSQTDLQNALNAKQVRVSSACAAGSSIRAIAADGTITCETDDNNGTWGSITGTLSAQTDLQSAFDAKQIADADLTSIAGLVGNIGLLRKTAANTWALDTNSYLTGNQTITLGGDLSGSGTTAITATIAADAVALGTDTTGDFVAGFSGTNGISVSGATGESSTPTVSLANGTAVGQVFVTGASPFTPALVTMSGDATISSVGAVTLANSGATAGTYKSVTVDAKGRVTAGTNPTTIAGYGITDALSNDPTSTQSAYFGDVYLYDDSTPSNYLQITNGANLTATRLLTLDTEDANRTLTLSGDASISGTNTGDQTITLTGDVTGSGTGSFAVTIGTGAVTSAKILDGTIAAADLAASAVTSAKILDGTIVSADIADGTIATADIAASAITPAKLSNGTAIGQVYVTGASPYTPALVTMSGDATISSAGAVTLANSGATAGTYKSVTVDAKGRVIAGTNPTTLTDYGITDALSSLTTSTQSAYFGDIYLYDDSTPSNYLQITNGANLTATRLLTLNTGDANRTLTLSGDATISGTNTGDQTITLTGDVTGSGTGSFAATIGTGTVTSAKILDGTITSADIADGAVSTAEIAANSITPAKLSNGTAAGQVYVTGASPYTPALVTMSGDATISSAGLLTIGSDAVALGTNTSGNYVAGLTGGTGITISGTAAEGWSPTVSISTVPVANGGTGKTTLTSNYLLKGNGTSAVASSVLYDNGTSLGIGTTSPTAAMLQIDTSSTSMNAVHGTSAVLGSGALTGVNDASNTTVSVNGAAGLLGVFTGTGGAVGANVVGVIGSMTTDNYGNRVGGWFSSSVSGAYLGNHWGIYSGAKDGLTATGGVFVTEADTNNTTESRGISVLNSDNDTNDYGVYVTSEGTGPGSGIYVTKGSVRVADLAAASGTSFLTVDSGGNFAVGDATSSMGTVSSVGLSLPGLFTVSGSPVTTSGTLSATYATQTANTVFAGPNGANGMPYFRKILSADITDLTIATADIANSAITPAKLSNGTAAGQVYVTGASPYTPALVTMSGDATISSAGAVTISSDAVALGTNTTGNYIATIAGGTGITVSGSGSESAAATVTVDTSSIQSRVSGTCTASQSSIYAVNSDGTVSCNSNTWSATTLAETEDRSIAPSEISGQSMRFGFGTYGNNNSSPYADYLHFNSWGDSSGGKPNLLTLNKTSMGMRLYQGTYGSTSAYSTYKDVVLAENTPSYGYLLKYYGTGTGVSATNSIIYDNGSTAYVYGGLYNSGNATLGADTLVVDSANGYTVSGTTNTTPTNLANIFLGTTDGNVAVLDGRGANYSPLWAIGKNDTSSIVHARNYSTNRQNGASGVIGIVDGSGGGTGVNIIGVQGDVRNDALGNLAGGYFTSQSSGTLGAHIGVLAIATYGATATAGSFITYADASGGTQNTGVAISQQDTDSNDYGMTVDSAGTGAGSGIWVKNGTVRLDELGTANSSTYICRNTSNELSTCSSSIRYKENVTDYTPGLAEVLRLRPVEYDWKNGGSHDLGFIAEEVASVDPMLAFKNENNQIEGVKYDKITTVLVNGMKEQQAQIEELKGQVSSKDEQIENLNSRLETLESELAQIKQMLSK